MAKHTFFEMLGGYTNGDNESSGKKFRSQTVTGSANRVSITRIGKYVSRFFDKLTKVISYTQSRTYGTFFCVFGVLSLVIHYIKDYISAYTVIPLEVVILP